MALVVINDDAEFPEGPIVHQDHLIYAEYGGHRITVWDGKRNSRLWEKQGSGPAAVIPYCKDLLVLCYDANELVQISFDGKTIATYVQDKNGMAIVGPNDATPDGNGGVYFTASGPLGEEHITGRVLHLSEGGLIQELANDIHYPNGISLGPDRSRLYIAETYAFRIISFGVEGIGTLTDRKLFARMSELGEPHDAATDGLKIGPDCNFYVGLGNYGRIVVVDQNRQVLRRIAVPSTAAPNLTFSTDGKTIYVMAVDDPLRPPYKGRVFAVSD